MKKKRKSLFGKKAPEAKASPSRCDVKENHVVTIDYTISDDTGAFLDTTEGHGAFSYMHGSNEIIPSLQAALEGHFPGDQIAEHISSQDGYGAYDESKIQMFETPLFLEEDAREGMQYEIMTDEGLRSVTVLSNEGNIVKTDLNHPLAGKSFNFEATIISVRPASIEEVEMSIVS
ncbi:MAG: peptidylprolyl isomerase [Thiothrix sp.]|nr:MAG: peptidylprolyl isomerase [Thiothrix sp.]